MVCKADAERARELVSSWERLDDLPRVRESSSCGEDLR